MDTTLLVQIEGVYQRLDIYEDLPISLIIQQTDLTDLNGRRAPYAKQFTIPNTNNNANIFEHYYEVNGTDFNPLQKLPCVVQYRGTDIFNGYLRLSSVVNQPTFQEYDVYILGEVADFASEIRNITLRDLDWTDLQHELDYDNIVLSWEAKDNDTDGLFGGKIIYPMINYGLPYQSDTGTTPNFSYSFDLPTSFSLSGNALPPQIFKPAIKIREIIERIFDQTGYEIVSDFLDGEYFKSIYMDTFNNGLLGVEVASAVTNQNIFKANSPQKQYRYTKQLDWTGDALKLFRLWDVYPESYDPLNNYINNENGAFQVPYGGDYYWNLRFNYQANDPTFLQGAFRIVAFKSTNINNISGGTRIYESEEFNLVGAISPRDINLFFSGSCNPGDYISVYLEETRFPLYVPSFASNRGEYTISPFSEAGITDRNISYDLYESPDLAGTQLVDIKLGIPDINCFEFFKSMVTMFNLIVVQDEVEKEIKIEPLTWYYNDVDRTEKDFTNRLDLNSTWKVEPLSFELSKELVWTNQLSSEEYLNKLYEDTNQHAYGRYKFYSTSNIFTGEQRYEVPFASLPSSGITNGPNFIIPAIYRELNGRQDAYSSKPHLFFWVGNRYAYKDVAKTVQGSWYFLSGATPVEQTTYPCVNHLSLLDSVVPEIISDLNFISTFDFFGNTNNQIAQFTPYDLFSLWWRDYIQNTYSPESRRLTGKFYFEPIDAYDTKLTDKIWVKDAFYRIEKINEANLIEPKMTEILLIKDETPYYKIEPPTPIYALSGNTAYPGISPAFTTLCYVSNNKDLVCNETAPISGVTTFGTGVLANFEKVFYDNGTAMVIFPAGTYIRQTTSTDVFVVADNYGRILESPC